MRGDSVCTIVRYDAAFDDTVNYTARCAVGDNAEVMPVISLWLIETLTATPEAGTIEIPPLRLATLVPLLLIMELLTNNSEFADGSNLMPPKGPKLVPCALLTLVMTQFSMYSAAMFWASTLYPSP